MSHKIQKKGRRRTIRPELIREILDKHNIIAVVGASRNPEKYGHQVYRDLKEAGYKVYPVNPNADKILGDKAYPSLESLPEKPDVVNIVVPPRVTEKIVEQCSRLFGCSRVPKATEPYNTVRKTALKWFTASA